MLVGIDIGGTFTDAVCVDGGAEHTVKIPTTSPDPSHGAYQALKLAIAAAGKDGSDVVSLAHGTTVATNAVIERNLVSVGMLTTRGFADVLAIGRQTRPDLYDLTFEPRWVPVPTDHRREVLERTHADGGIEHEPDRDECLRQVQALVDDQVQAIAVCFLHSYANPANERLVAKWISEVFAEVRVVCSADAAREFREYERFSTAVLDAGLGSLMTGYLDRFRTNAADLGVGNQPLVMQSSGGLTDLPEIGEHPTRTLLSGPAGGVLGAIEIANSVNARNILTFDMGGTSADIALIEDGAPKTLNVRRISDVPILGRTLDIRAIGAGGGSIAWVDSGGRLRVGPRSAGAVPGPAAYGRGGSHPTVTDAHVAVGTLPAGGRFGNDITLDRQAAVDAISRDVAEPLGLSPLVAAHAILEIVNTNMALTARQVALAQGVDIRDFALVAFGGAGPLHAAHLAQELGMARVVVPAHPGALAARGLLAAEVQTEFVRSKVQTLAISALDNLNAQAASLQQEAEAWWKNQHRDGDIELTYFGDFRYRGQGHTLRLELQGSQWAPTDVAVISKRFNKAHQHVNGFIAPSTPVEITNLRLLLRHAAIRRPSPNENGVIPTEHSTAGSASTPSLTTAVRDADGSTTEWSVYQFGELPSEVAVDGPALVLHGDSTCVVPAGTTATASRDRQAFEIQLDHAVQHAAEGNENNEL